MSDLTSRRCVPCRGAVSPLRGEALDPYRREVPSWTIVDEHHLHKAHRFPDFRQALAFTNRVGEIAEAEGHHPDILLGWGKVEITIWTHAAGGLTENDFILAARIDALAAGS